MNAFLRFTSLLLAALLIGTMFGIWLGFDPKALSARAYVEMQQNAIRALNITLPLLGLACIVLTTTLAWRTPDPRVRLCLIAAVILLVAAGLITRFANQPINAVVARWNPQSPPGNWQDMRDTWWYWHRVRTIVGIAALCFMILPAVIPERRVTNVA